ncbi:MAG: LytTR family DNA-binding domain-containing protein [Sinimarinibacterium flocculans]|uniref:LytTR family DNA-binding domain-containing protein n=1 Tax=Sinimarinibacterium flocculans TaxID=985250 RepID=UPI003512C7E0
MPATARTAYERYQPWRPTVEIGFWLVLLTVNAVANSLTTQIDIRRAGLPIAAWEPVVWEVSSSLMWLLIVPAVAALNRRLPLTRDTWRRALAVHALASVAVCLVHVVGMVGLRQIVYRSQGLDYDFGPWPRELWYEYLKDIRSYALLILVFDFYGLLMRRLQGEVHLLAEPDEGPPVEPVERPERFLVRKVGREFLVAAADIEWLQAWGNYVNLRVRGHDYPLRSTIGGIEARLDPARFVRIHRSYIVNLDQIASIEPLDTGDARVHLKDGATLPCSRRYRAALRGRVASEHAAATPA